MERDALDQVLELLIPDHFYSPAHRRVYEACLALVRDSQPIDAVTVAGWLKSRERLAEIGGVPFLTRLVDSVPSVANVQAYARTVREKWRTRALISTCQRVSAEGYGDVGSVQGFIDNAEQAIYELARTPESSTVKTLKEVIIQSFNKIQEAGSRGSRITGVPTGFAKIDEMTSGLHDGELIIVAARPGMGKTSFVLNVAVNVAAPSLIQDESGEGPIERPGSGVAVFSLEMPADQLATRMVCSEARVDVSKVRKGMLSAEDWSNLTRGASFLSQIPVWIDDTAAITLLDVRSKVRRIQAELSRSTPEGEPPRKLGLVIIDYLQLMKGRDGVNSREQEISEISRGLKQLSKELHVAVIALSQLNRSVESRPDKRPQLSDLRECVTGDTLVQLADGRRTPICDLVGTTPDVLAMNDQGKIVPAKSDLVWSVGHREVFDVVLASGRRVRATAKHRFYTGRGWLRVGDLNKGERAAIARRIPQPASPIRWTEHEIVLLGHMVGDGSYLVHQPLRYTTASEENSRAVTDAAIAMGCEVTRHAGRGNWHQLVLRGNGNRWHPAAVNLWLRTKGIYGQRSHEKHLPPEVFQLEDPQVALLLQHLWATDGTIFTRKAGSKGSHVISFATCSHRLAMDVAALLCRLGIVGRIRTIAQASHRPLHHVTISGVEAQLRFLSLVGAFGPRAPQAIKLREALRDIKANSNVDTLPIEVFAQIKRAATTAGFSQRDLTDARGTSHGGSSHFRFAPSRDVVTSYANVLGSADLLARATDDLFWDVVVDIVPAGTEEVFDLTVPGHASWLADGIVSHNSGAIEQDADMIMFIYRDDYYKEDSQFKGIAEIIIAKQRNGPTGKAPTRFTNAYTRFDDLAPGEMPELPDE